METHIHSHMAMATQSTMDSGIYGYFGSQCLKGLKLNQPPLAGAITTSLGYARETDAAVAAESAEGAENDSEKTINRNLSPGRHH